MMTDYDDRYIHIHEYKQGSAGRSSDEVAAALRERGYDPAVYLWADVHNDDMTHRVVAWHKASETVVRPVNIFEPPDDYYYLIGVYSDGEVDGKFHPATAANVMYLRDASISESIYDETLALFKKDAERIDSIGGFWTGAIRGESLATGKEDA